MGTYIQLLFVSLIESKCGSSDKMVAWSAMDVAAIMQSPMGIFRYLLLSRPACLAIGGVRFWILSPLWVRFA